MIRGFLFFFLLSLHTPLVAVTDQPAKANVTSASVGVGSSQGEAFADAMSKLPIGATVYSRTTQKSGNEYTVILYWKK